MPTRQTSLASSPTQPGYVRQTGIVTQHKRGVISTAVTLATAVTTIPTIPSSGTGDVVAYPTVVWAQVEAGQPNPVYFTVDGSTPTATNGMQLPTAPSMIPLPYPDQIKNSGAVSATNQQLQFFAPGATNVQFLFEYW